MRENLDKFPFPYRGKNSIKFENFPDREKVDKLSRISEGKKTLPLTGGKKVFSLTVNEGKKLCEAHAQQLLPLAVDKSKFFKE